MKSLIMNISSLCLLSALCDQVMRSSRFLSAVRFALGIEITWRMMRILDDLGSSFF